MRRSNMDFHNVLLTSKTPNGKAFEVVVVVAFIIQGEIGK